MISRPYAIVDVFAQSPLEGNPLAVFPDGAGLEGEVMQRTARELQLSETVFLLRPGHAVAADRRARIFTPRAELAFAGHPVLGAAFVLSAGRPARLRIQTGAGVLPVAVEAGTDDGRLYGELEHASPEPEPFPRARELLAALHVSESRLPVEAYRNGPWHVYVALSDEREVRELEPDMAALSRLGDSLGVSCFAGSGSRFKTRMFAPALGVAEDPATGSAAGPLAAHLVRHGVLTAGQEIEIRQGEEIGRPSLLRARVAPNGETVVVGGSGYVVAHGEYRLQ